MQLLLLQVEAGRFGINWEGPIPCDMDDDGNVPPTQCPISPLDLAELEDFFSPLADSSCYGISFISECCRVCFKSSIVFPLVTV